MKKYKQINKQLKNLYHQKFLYKYFDIVEVKIWSLLNSEIWSKDRAFNQDFEYMIMRKLNEI